MREEYVASQEAAKRYNNQGRSDGQKSSETDLRTGMSLREALQILNVEDLSDQEKIQKSYDHLFKANDKANGGSLYLQSKVRTCPNLSWISNWKC